MVGKNIFTKIEGMWIKPCGDCVNCDRLKAVKMERSVLLHADKIGNRRVGDFVVDSVD